MADRKGLGWVRLDHVAIAAEDPEGGVQVLGQALRP